MPSMPHAPPSGFDDLPVEDQIAYVEALWDRIADQATDLPVPEWHLEVIRERRAELAAEPGDTRSWPEVRDELRELLRKRRSS